MSLRVRRTLQQHHDSGIGIRALCTLCRAMREVDVAAMLAKLGPEFSYWNKRGRCWKPGCRGRVRFQGLGGWPHLMADEAVEWRWTFQEMEERRAILDEQRKASQG